MSTPLSPMLGEAKGASVFGRNREIRGQLARCWTDEVELFDRMLVKILTIPTGALAAGRRR